MNAIATSPRLLTKPQLAAALGICPRQVQKMAVAGEIPAIRISRKLVRYDLEAVLTAMQNQFGGRA
jgi:hypothetical protein